MEIDVIEVCSWLAIFILSVSYWFQIWKIHVHREVRDLSMTYHIFLAVGFAILAVTAYVEDSLIFLVKQVATTVPVLIIIGQMIYHRRDGWHDENLPLCSRCDGVELEEGWSHCPQCGHPKPEIEMAGVAGQT